VLNPWTPRDGEPFISDEIAAMIADIPISFESDSAELPFVAPQLAEGSPPIRDLAPHLVSVLEEVQELVATGNKQPSPTLR
jgi:hypothetical protein